MILGELLFERFGSNPVKKKLDHEICPAWGLDLEAQFHEHYMGSFHSRCRYTSGRTFFTPFGNNGYSFVEFGTILSSRCALLILVCCWRGLRWLLEQPDGSFLPNMPRFQWLWSVIEVWVHLKKKSLPFLFPHSVSWFSHPLKGIVLTVYTSPQKVQL